MLSIVAILYDRENSSLKALIYAIKKAKEYSSNVIVVSDWKMGFSKRLDQISPKGLSYMHAERNFAGKNSLDYALFDAAISLKRAGVNKFIILTDDVDFVEIIRRLNNDCVPSHVIGIGGISCSKKLQAYFDEFIYYPPSIVIKLKNDYLIPSGEPLDEVRQCLVKAYNFADKGGGWVTICQLAVALKTIYPELVFPNDHPRKLRDIIKLYHVSFEWRRDGNRILVREKCSQIVGE